MNDAEKLKHLLGHWVEHNLAHQEEFRKWGERARGMGLEEASADILVAVTKLGEANEHLRKAMGRL